MAFTGLGGSANLGSATGFLFINSTGVRKGLDDASKAIGKFDASSRASATSAAQLSQANVALAAAQSDLRSAMADHASNLTLASRAQADLTAQQTNYNAKAARTSAIESSLVTSKNQIIDADDKLAKNTVRLTAATEALNSAREKAILVGTRDQALAIQSQKNRLAQAKANQLLEKASTNLARNNLIAQQELLREMRKAGAPKADIKNQLLNVTEAKKALRDAAFSLREANAVASSAQRQVTQATKEYKIAEEAAIKSVDRRIVKEHELAVAERARISAQREAAQHSHRLDRINLSSAVANEKAAKSALNSAIAESRAADAAVAASSRRLSESTRLAEVATANHRKIAESAKAAADAEIASAKRAVTQVLDSYARIGVTIGGGLTIGLAAATSQFASFEEEMANVAAISPSLDASFESLKMEVLELSTALGKSPQDIARGLFTVAQAGITDAQQAIEVTRLATQAAVAGRTTVEEATKPLIGLMNAYGLSVEQAAKSLDVLFQAAQDGVFDFKDLSSQLGDNLSIASALNVPITDIAAAYVVLTKRSNSLAETTTQVNAIMNSFLKPSKALSETVKRYTGETAQAYFRTHDLADVLLLVTRMFEDNADAAGKLFPNLRAIRGIYGLTAEEAEAFRVEVQKLQIEQIKGGATARVLARQQEATAYQFRQAREEIRRAVILIGQDAAPAFLSLAKSLGSVADAFSSLSPATRSTISTMIQFGGLGLIVSAGFAKMLSMLLGLKANFLIAAASARNFLTSLRTLRGTMAAISTGLLVAGIGLLIYRFIEAREKINAAKRALEGLTSAIETLNEAAAQSALEGYGQRTKDIETLAAMFGGLEISIHEAMVEAQKGNKLKGIWGEATSWITGYKSEVETLTEVSERLTAIQVKLFDAIRNPAVDSTKLVEAFRKEYEKFQTDPNFGIVNLENNIQNILDNLEDYAISSEKAKKEVEELAEASEMDGEALISFMSTAEDRAAEFASAIKGASDAAIAAQDDLGDLADPLAALQRLMNTTGDSAFATYLKLQKLGFVKFSGPEREALRVADAIAKAEGRIGRINESISNNNEDIAMWQGNISFVDETLGDHNDTMEEYIGKLNRGEISQEEFNNAVASGEAHRSFAELVKLYEEGAIDCETYNKALEAGTFIIERSEGALRDERVEQVKNVIALADAIKARDKANKNYKELTDEQRAFIAGLQDERTQIALQTAALLAMLEAVGSIPKGATAKFLADASQANPILAEVLGQIGTIDGEHTAEIDLDGAQGVISQLEDIEGVKMRAVDDNTTIKVAVSGADADRKIREYLKLNGKELAESGIDVEFSVNGKVFGPDDPANPMNEYLAKEAEIAEKSTKADIDINVTGVEDVQDAAAAVDALSNVGAVQFSPSTAIVVTGAGNAQHQLEATKEKAEEIPPTVTVTVETTGDLTKLPDIKTALETFAEEIKVPGETAGANYLIGFNSGIEGNTPVFVTNVRNQMVAALNQALNDIFNAGWYAGRFYDAGLISGMASRATDVYQAARNLGIGIHNSVVNAIQAHSPSRLAIFAGRSYVQGLVLSLRNGESEAASQARSLALATSGAFAQQFESTRFMPFQVDAIAGQQRLSAAQMNVGRSMSSGSTFNVSPSITVNGGQTNEDTAEVIWRRLEDGLIQFAARTGVEA